MITNKDLYTHIIHGQKKFSKPSEVGEYLHSVNINAPLNLRYKSPPSGVPDYSRSAKVDEKFTEINRRGLEPDEVRKVFDALHGR